MKKTKKLLSVLLAMLLVCTLLTACKEDKLVIEEPDTDSNAQTSEDSKDDASSKMVTKVSDNCIVVRTTQESLEGKTDMSLIDYMAKLKEKGEVEFAISDGMITSINGVANPADYSSCWMLYTSDEENANKAWGVVEYKGNEYGSAVSGAETLVIKPDQLYIWVYKSFN